MNLGPRHQRVHLIDRIARIGGDDGVASFGIGPGEMGEAFFASDELAARKLILLGVELLSTGGTYDFLKGLALPVTAVEDVTGYPSILGGRVKTLHPKNFWRNPQPQRK